MPGSQKVSTRRLAKVLGPMLDFISIPGVFGDIGTWGEWIAYFPSGLFAQSCAVIGLVLIVIGFWEQIEALYGHIVRRNGHDALFRTQKGSLSVEGLKAKTTKPILDAEDTETKFDDVDYSDSG